MTATQEALEELERCKVRLVAYRDARRSGHDGNSEHAAAMRASLDLSRVLARWRQARATGVSNGKEK